MKDKRTMKELFNACNPDFILCNTTGSYEYIMALSYFTQGYGRGVLDTIQQRRDMEEESK